MGSLLPTWDIESEPAPLSVEEELKIHKVELERKSLTRRSLEGNPLERKSPGSTEGKHAMLWKVAEKQHQDDEAVPVGVAQPALARRSSGPPVLQRKSGPVMKVKIRGHKGATVVLETDSQQGTPHEDEHEGDQVNLAPMSKDKWWRKLSSSALNELEKDAYDGGDGPSSYVPQFDLTGTNPYTNAVEAQ